MRSSRTLLCLFVVAGPLLVAAPAAADEFVDRVNAAYSSVRPADRSDRILLPALAAMADPPAAIATPLAAQLLTAESPDYSAESPVQSPSMSLTFT
jgi:hypothetical protein